MYIVRLCYTRGNGVLYMLKKTYQLVQLVHTFPESTALSSITKKKRFSSFAKPPSVLNLYFERQVKSLYSITQARATGQNPKYSKKNYPPPNQSRHRKAVTTNTHRRVVQVALS